MGCDYPLKGFRPPGGGRLVFNPSKGIQSTGALQVPCGNCVGCKLEKARQWALRMQHESLFHDHNSFLTLTYDDAHLPHDYGLDKEHVQLFTKRLRRRIEPTLIRFFACGEYGEQKGRPHYHAIIFGWSPPDGVFLFNSRHGNAIYTSAMLQDTWGMGVCSFGKVTPQSCGYTARYAMKKVRGADDYAADYYHRCSPVDGRMYNVQPEFALMSNRPGIGANFADTYKSDYYPSGFVTVDGKKQAAPRYYLNRLTEEEQHEVKRLRARGSTQPRSERTMERKIAREGVRNARIQPLKREL